GYATMNGGTTGGAGGPTITVSSLTALRDAVLSTSPKIIRITSIIQGDGESIDVGSNTSILGSCGGGLTGGGFRVKKSSNVIIRNLKLYKSKAPTDLIEIQASTNVWVDHNEFYSDMNSGKDYYDGACDVNHGSDWVTISWNYFHDHYKTSLVGHSDNNGSED
ncbi:polysaccharide lyase family 1 protein, partial [Tulasnella calospora MUT 4182]